jgi:hypothetical protein
MTFELYDILNSSVYKPYPNDFVYNFVSLEVVDLFNNSFSSSISPDIAQLTSIREIMIEQNYLTGTIPSEIALLTKLERLWLHDNALSGSLPAEICHLIAYQSVHVSVDCWLVACDCGCDCEMSTYQDGESHSDEGDNGTSESNNSIWDRFVDWFSGMFPS